MIVCICKCVSDREICQAIDEGHTSLKALARHCGAGTGVGCGGCHATLREMVRKRGPESCRRVSEPNQSSLFKLATLPRSGYFVEHEDETKR
jgi:bacterioferritin-associated ferredoxin